MGALGGGTPGNSEERLAHGVVGFTLELCELASGDGTVLFTCRWVELASVLRWEGPVKCLT